MARLDLSRRMGVADGTLGRIKYGRGNPTLDVVDRIANYFRIAPWKLIQPENEDANALIGQLANMATPRSRAALEAISKAADDGRLTDDDLLLLQRIAQRFMGADR
ncbi:MAG TPA: helix-turn-helix transcriptional regulator [Frateuria sp.]|nr:helix-turn-helix transcriptional regulator [Frateuria sp.]HET6807213.1 helix-turn-helix transcriptional regulator [Frateuria sp.]